MKDFPWFKLYTARFLLDTIEMDDATCGRHVRRMVRGWVTGKLTDFPELSEQAEKMERISEKRSHAGMIGGKSKANAKQMPSKCQAKRSKPSISSISSSSSSSSEEDIEAKKKDEVKGPTWRDSYEVYEKLAGDAWDALMANPQWRADREKYHPKLDIGLTMEKSYNDFWGKECGWKHKKKTKGLSIDWERTFTNALSQRCNQVFRNEAKKFNQFSR